MTLRGPSRIGPAALLCLIAALSAIQTIGMGPSLVSATNTMTINLTKAPASTEPASASGLISVNLDSGQTQVELHRATPNATFTALFVSTSTLQVGSLATDSKGDAQVLATLAKGAYAGAFQVARLGIVQYLSNDTAFSVGVSSSISATVSNSTITQVSSQTVATQSTTPENITSPLLLQVQPTSATITAGAIATFSIHIVGNSFAQLFLVARGVPPHSVAIFTPNSGIANPQFQGTLTIATSGDTPPGSYAITTVASVAGQELTSQVTLQILTPVSVVSTLSNTTQVASLSMTVGTDQAQYSPNMTVTVQGHVTDNTGDAVTGASIAIQVDAPNGAEVFYINNIYTDTAGFYQTQLTLPNNSQTGTFTVFSSATKAGYVGATTRSTFVVGTSSTPSVIIKNVYAGDSTGNPSATFTPGQTIWIWVVIQNNGASFQGVVWIQVRDPNGVPVQIQIHIAQLGAGQTIKDGLGFSIGGNAALGIYTVNALVSDKLISQGGTFLANANTQFALVG